MSERLRDLRMRLTQLHRLLLAEERGAWEAAHGRVATSHELLQLVLHHEQFAWLRALSAMIAAIDAAVDEANGDPPAADVEAFFRQTHDLLRSGGDGSFETNYRAALQRSPDVVMAHAAIVKLL